MSVRSTTSMRKNSAAHLDYLFNWAAWLETGETIVDAQFVVDGTDTALTVMQSEFTGTDATVWLRDGTPGVTYEVFCTITTNSTPPRIDVRMLRLFID